MAETTINVKLLFGDASSDVKAKLTMDGEGTFVNVEANPVTAGTEAVLTGIQIGETKYRVVDTGTVVTANPVLAGTEAKLSGIQVGDTKYKVLDVDVVANPELAGTEAELTGLQVGDTKYKITPNPTVPTIPDAPTVDGNYKLVVTSGVASWVAIE